MHDKIIYISAENCFYSGFSSGNRRVISSASLFLAFSETTNRPCPSFSYSDPSFI